MSKKVFISFIIFFFISYNVYAANTKPQDLLEVDFGSVKAIKTVHQVGSFSLQVKTAQPNGVAIETSGLVNYQNNERIPTERITLLLNDKTVVMATTPLMVDIDEKLNDKQFDIKFDLDLEPIDHPGIYQGIIQFKFWEMKQNQIKWLDPIQVSLKVQVESWVCLKTKATYIRFEPEKPLINRNLVNTEPLIIQVASNSNWQLSLSITSDDTQMKNVPLFVIVDDSSKQYQGTGQISITVQDGKKVIAFGPSTVSDKNYWCNIPVDIYMNDYTRYQTGTYYFKFHFFEEELKQ